MLAIPVESRLARLQRGFAEAIFSCDAPIPATIRAATGTACFSRFGVYRNNVIASLMGAVASRYPVCRKLLSPETFEGAARLYVLTEPPCSPVLLHYGDSFPHFLRRIGAGAATEYVADIAELETARVRAYHAADVDPLGMDAFRRLAEADLPMLQMKLHPSVTLLASRFPIVSAWQSGVSDADPGEMAWQAEAALIARPQNQVDVRRLPVGGFAFLSAIADGRTIGEAASRAAAGEPAFDLADCIAVMLSAAIATDLVTPDHSLKASCK